MTIADAIARTDALKPNAYTQNEKVKWLSELDGRVKREIHDTHEGLLENAFTDYIPNLFTVQLLVPEPYSEIYIYWLFTKIDFLNAETARFNNSAMMFNTAWLNYANYINRTHAPKMPNRIASV